MPMTSNILLFLVLKNKSEVHMDVNLLKEGMVASRSEILLGLK